jgi:hypothetical protein
MGLRVGLYCALGANSLGSLDWGLFFPVDSSGPRIEQEAVLACMIYGR